MEPGAIFEESGCSSSRPDAPSEYGLHDSHFQLPLRQISTRLGEAETGRETNDDSDDDFEELSCDLNDGNSDGSWQDISTPVAHTLTKVRRSSYFF